MAFNPVPTKNGNLPTEPPPPVVVVPRSGSNTPAPAPDVPTPTPVEPGIVEILTKPIEQAVKLSQDIGGVAIGGFVLAIAVAVFLWVWKKRS